MPERGHASYQAYRGDTTERRAEVPASREEAIRAVKEAYGTRLPKTKIDCWAVFQERHPNSEQSGEIELHFDSVARIVLAFRL